MPAVTGRRTCAAVSEAFERIASTDGCRRGSGDFLTPVSPLAERLTATEVAAIPFSVRIYKVCCCPADGNPLRGKSTWVSSSLGTELARQRGIPLKCAVRWETIIVKFR